MQIRTNKLTTFLASLGATVFLLTSSASAHITVQPGEATTSDWLTFTVSVPNEKEVANTQLKLIIPDGLEHVTPTVKTGWTVATEKTGEGEETSIKSITWSGGNIPAGLRDDFTFSAKTPDKAGELQWKSYQTYADGTTVAWDLSREGQPVSADGSPDFSKSGPYSITVVAAGGSTSAPIGTPAKDNTADWALYLAAVATILSLAGIFLATRKPSSQPALHKK